MAATRVALSMGDRVLTRARQISRARGTSISKLFVSFISIQPDVVEEDRELPPLTRQALGLARCDTKLPKDWNWRSLLEDSLVEKFGG